MTMTTSSLSDQIYAGMKRKLAQGDYLPGMLLSENELAAEFGMSRTPVRAALSRLESDGYVVSLKNRGILIKELSGKEILDMFEVISSLQVFIMEAASLGFVTLDLQALERVLKAQIEATEEKDYPAYTGHSLEFTRLLIEAAHNEAMLAMIDGYKEKLMWAAVVNYKRTPLHKHYSGTDVNTLLFEALQAGDYALAKRRILEGWAAIRQRAFSGMIV
ncbi:GntR family transcriptional regulator [Paenibacillus pinistramenti]|uniref:GntR family transcriptional regulator n=1 Tax=Paenibacillus pinistramenti TaxID=1768003 RepID=UPI0011085B9D|nr:GntR family transcriptional regulator [Paenibacillus pinistramenti]